MRIFTNYQKFLKQLDEVKALKEKPSLLLHVCCTPCSCYPLLLLKDYFNITIYYNNSNIYPKSEYDLRLITLKKYVNDINSEYNINIKIITNEYDYEYFDKILKVRKDDKEGSIRCFTCYALRYKDLCEYASKNNYEYVCSVMTISRQKNEEMINKILSSYANKYPNIKYLYSNFKKDKGLEKAQKIVREKNIYSQHYCGCKYGETYKE